MSSRVFPALAQLPGMAWPVTRTPMFQTRLQRSISGKRTTIADWTTPLWEWELDVNVMRSQSGFTEWQAFITFLSQALGQFDTWLWTEPDDSSVTGQTVGIGNATTVAFQLVRQLQGGGFLEPVLAPNIVADIYLAGAPVPNAGLTAPSPPTLGDVAGGTIGATTYYAKVTLATPTGETPASAEASRAVAGNRLLQVVAPAVVGQAYGWHAYVGTTTGAETRQNATVIPFSQNWTEPFSGLTAGLAVPGGNSFALGAWGSSTPGLVTFTSAPAAATVITADFTYFWPCAFEEDKWAIQNILAGRYNVKKLKFISVK
jgi:hypothetical protein